MDTLDKLLVFNFMPLSVWSIDSNLSKIAHISGSTGHCEELRTKGHIESAVIRCSSSKKTALYHCPLFPLFMQDRRVAPSPLSPLHSPATHRMHQEPKCPYQHCQQHHAQAEKCRRKSFDFTTHDGTSKRCGFGSESQWFAPRLDLCCSFRTLVVSSLEGTL